MAPEMTWVEMVEEACSTVAPKFMSRMAIKSYLTEKHGYVDNAMSKNHLKNALTKLDKKGDSYRAKKKVTKKNSAEAKAKRAAKAAALKAKKAAKKAAVAAKKKAAKEKKAAKKAAAAAKKKAAAAKRLSLIHI